MAIQSISIVFECCILRVLFLNEFMAVSIDLSTKAHAKRDVSAHLKSIVGGIVSFSDLGYCCKRREYSTKRRNFVGQLSCMYLTTSA